MGDGHAAVISMAGTLPGLSDMVTLTAPHCGPTFNLYDTCDVVQGDTLRALWPIAAHNWSQ